MQPPVFFTLIRVFCRSFYLVAIRRCTYAFSMIYRRSPLSPTPLTAGSAGNNVGKIRLML